jgi:hypothetical protein
MGLLPRSVLLQEATGRRNRCDWHQSVCDSLKELIRNSLAPARPCTCLRGRSAACAGRARAAAGGLSAGLARAGRAAAACSGSCPCATCSACCASTPTCTAARAARPCRACTSTGWPSSTRRAGCLRGGRARVRVWGCSSRSVRTRPLLFTARLMETLPPMTREQLWLPCRGCCLCRHWTSLFLTPRRLAAKVVVYVSLSPERPKWCAPAAVND